MSQVPYNKTTHSNDGPFSRRRMMRLGVNLVISSCLASIVLVVLATIVLSEDNRSSITSMGMLVLFFVVATGFPLAIAISSAVKLVRAIRGYRKLPKMTSEDLKARAAIVKERMQTEMMRIPYRGVGSSHTPDRWGVFTDSFVDLSRETWRTVPNYLLDRELAMWAMCQRLGTPDTFWRYVEEHRLRPPLPGMLAESFRDQIDPAAFVQRNHFSIPGDIEMSVSDLVFAHHRHATPGNRSKFFVTTSTYVEADFSSPHSLVIQRGEEELISKIFVRDNQSEASSSVFNDSFIVRSDDDAWAARVLSPAVQYMLIQRKPLILEIDDGRIALSALGKPEWLSETEILELAETLKEIIEALSTAIPQG